MAAKQQPAGSMEKKSLNSGQSAASASPAKCQAQFELGITLALFLWPSLSLAVTNNWGGPSSSAKREWLAQQTIDLLVDPENADVDGEWIETFLLQVMQDEFEVAVDDESAYEVAERIVGLRKACEKGDFAEVGLMQEKWNQRAGREDVGGSFERRERDERDDETSDEEDEDDSDDDNGPGGVDIDMDEAPPLVRVREPVVPEVDEDGFTKVTTKKKR